MSNTITGRRIISAEINWMEDWANDPNLIVYTDKILRLEDFRYQQYGPLYFAFDLKSGQCSYFAYQGPGNGYGGAHFDLQMRDGTRQKLIGPWSSRSSVMNSNGFPHSVEVTLRKPGKKYGGIAGAMLIDHATHALKIADPDARLVKTEEHNEISYVIEKVR